MTCHPARPLQLSQRHLICRAGYRSEAVYIRSEDAAMSNGIGFVQTLAIAATFSELPFYKDSTHEDGLPRPSLLMQDRHVDWDLLTFTTVEGAPDYGDTLHSVSDKMWRVFAGTGQLQSLQWTDLTCNSCGGPASKQCIVTRTSQPQHSCAGGLAAHSFCPCQHECCAFSNISSSATTGLPL